MPSDRRIGPDLLLLGGAAGVAAFAGVPVWSSLLAGVLGNTGYHLSRRAWAAWEKDVSTSGHDLQRLSVMRKARP